MNDRQFDPAVCLMPSPAVCWLSQLVLSQPDKGPSAPGSVWQGFYLDSCPFNCATVGILQFKDISPCPLKIWVLDLGAKGRPESLLWRLSSQSFMVSDAPGSNISTVAWLCSYHYTFMLSITRSCRLVLFLSLTRPNSDIRWGFNDFETWLFPQLSRRSVSSSVIQTLEMTLIHSPYPASFPTILTGYYSILNSSKLLILQSLPQYPSSTELPACPQWKLPDSSGLDHRLHFMYSTWLVSDCLSFLPRWTHVPMPGEGRSQNYCSFRACTDVGMWEMLNKDLLSWMEYSNLDDKGQSLQGGLHTKPEWLIWFPY